MDRISWMDHVASISTALATGLVTGALWALAYAPKFSPLSLLLAHAAAAVLVWVAVRAIVRGIPGPLPVALSTVLALVVAPAVLAPPYLAALLWGAPALVADVAAAAVSVVLGVGLARWLSRGGTRRLVAALALAACIASPLLVARWFAAARDVPATWGVRLPAPFPSRPVLVFGIDGGDWRVAAPLIRAGRLPNLARLVTEGRHGVLRSIEPTQSPVVWTSIFTGQPPERHGITGWYRSDSRNLRAAPLWDVFAAQGRTALAVNVPGSWPPQEIPGGAVVSGMPVPGADISVFGLPFGYVVSSTPGRGAVETVHASQAAPGRFRFDLPLELPLVDRGRFAVRSELVEKLARHFLVRQRRRTVAVEAIVAGGAVTVRSPAVVSAAELPVDGAPRWLTLSDGRREAVTVAAVMRASSDRIELYFARADQAPWAPLMRFASGLPSDLLADRDHPYVVEGPGWLIWRDLRVDRPLVDALLAVERRHGELVAAAVARLHPDLVCYVATITDRLQHPFLAFHADPGGRPAAAPPAALQTRDPVTEAYELADAELGRLLALMPADTLVMVVSDHGFALRPASGDAGHRLEGMWVARGPMIAPDAAPLELSVLDVVPTLMRCLGAPVADDLRGVARPELCAAVPTPPRVASYSAARPTSVGAYRIDRTREEQLRSLGYIQ